MERSAYRFRPTLRPDMEGADLILSHAGAGSGRLQCDAACCGSVATPKGFPWQPTNVALCALCPSAPTYQPILLLLLYALS